MFRIGLFDSQTISSLYKDLLCISHKVIDERFTKCKRN